MKDGLETEGGIRGMKVGEAYAEAQVFEVAQSWVEPGVGRWWGFGPFGNGGSRPKARAIVEPVEPAMLLAGTRRVKSRAPGTGSVHFDKSVHKWRARPPKRGNAGWTSVGTFETREGAEAALDAWLLEHKGGR